MVGDRGLEYAAEAIETLDELTNLQIDLYETGITEKGAAILGSCLSSISGHLKTLGLFVGNNRLESGGLEQIAAGLSKLEFLEEMFFDLSTNEIEKEAMKPLSDCFKTMKSLMILFMIFDDNKIENFGVKTLSYGLDTVPFLNKLTIRLTNCDVDKFRLFKM